MVTRKQDMVQRDLAFAIILRLNAHVFLSLNRLVQPVVVPSAYHQAPRELVDDNDLAVKKRAINLTEQGIERAETYFEVENLADIENTELYHCVSCPSTRRRAAQDSR